MEWFLKEALAPLNKNSGHHQLYNLLFFFNQKFLFIILQALFLALQFQFFSKHLAPDFSMPWAWQDLGLQGPGLQTSSRAPSDAMTSSSSTGTNRALGWEKSKNISFRVWWGQRGLPFLKQLSQRANSYPSKSTCHSFHWADLEVIASHDKVVGVEAQEPLQISQPVRWPVAAEKWRELQIITITHPLKTSAAFKELSWMSLARLR